eukprot:3142514-Prymnesium_polylepis.2
MVDTPVREAQQDEQRGAGSRARMGQHAARASDTATAREGRRIARATRAGGRRQQLVHRHGRP